jgi:hypothetical protein
MMSRVEGAPAVLHSSSLATVEFVIVVDNARRPEGAPAVMHSPSLATVEFVIVVDKAHRPEFSVSEASWSEVPPLCRHAGAYSKNLKRITVSRWDGVNVKKRSWLKAPVFLGRHGASNASCKESNNPAGRNMDANKPARKASLNMIDMIENDNVKVERRFSLAKPMRKVSLNMVEHDDRFGKAQLSPLKPMRKASINLLDKRYCLQKPMRKASMEMSVADASIYNAMKKPMRKASLDMAFVEQRTIPSVQTSTLETSSTCQRQHHLVDRAGPKNRSNSLDHVGQIFARVEI